MTVAQGTPRTDAVMLAFHQQYHIAQENDEDMSNWEGNLEMRLEDHARQLERENAALSAQVVELQQDAERYRWLRAAARTDTGEPWIARYHGGGISAWTLEFADAAIDAAKNVHSTVTRASSGGGT